MLNTVYIVLNMWRLYVYVQLENKYKLCNRFSFDNLYKLFL